MASHLTKNLRVGWITVIAWGARAVRERRGHRWRVGVQWTRPDYPAGAPSRAIARLARATCWSVEARIAYAIALHVGLVGA